MRGLSGAALLSVWEQGLHQDPVARGLTLFGAAAPDAAPAELAAAPFGRRDAALLRLRCATFGTRAECFVACPACAGELEFTVDLPALLADAADAGPGPWLLRTHGWRVTFRLPGAADVAAVVGAAEPWLALARRCVVEAVPDGDPADGGAAEVELPLAVTGELEAAMGRLDPLAELTLALRCADCGHGWDARFDVAGFLWREIEVAARTLLGEVDALARSYGWSEAEILALSAPRRRSYLELVGAR